MYQHKTAIKRGKWRVNDGRVSESSEGAINESSGYV